MALDIRYDESTGVFELHVRGILKRAEFAECEQQLAAIISAGNSPRGLVILRNFGGWERGEDWNNLDFMFSYGEKIAKIAIVGAGAKEAEVKAFTGAGLRPTPVKFFAEAEGDQARAWLLE